MRWRLAVPLALAWIASSFGAHAETSCGAPGKPACPLQDWMRRNLALALAKKDGAALATHFEEIGRRNPTKGQWANWNKFAKDGAEAARAGRFSGVITTCGRCHSVYRPEYIAKYRYRN